MFRFGYAPAGTGKFQLFQEVLFIRLNMTKWFELIRGLGVVLVLANAQIRDFISID